MEALQTLEPVIDKGSTQFILPHVISSAIGPGYDVKLHPVGKVPAREIRSFQESGTSLNPFNFG